MYFESKKDHLSSIMFLSFLVWVASNADLDELFTRDAVRDGLYRLFPTTSFFFISSPNEMRSSLLPSIPRIFLLSMAPKKAIGF